MINYHITAKVIDMKDEMEDKLIFEQKDDYTQVTMRFRKDQLKEMQNIKNRTKMTRDKIVEKMIDFALSRIQFK